MAVGGGRRGRRGEDYQRCCQRPLPCKTRLPLPASHMPAIAPAALLPPLPAPPRPPVPANGPAHGAAAAAPCTPRATGGGAQRAGSRSPRSPPLPTGARGGGPDGLHIAAIHPTASSVACRYPCLLFPPSPLPHNLQVRCTLTEHTCAPDIRIRPRVTSRCPRGLYNTTVPSFGACGSGRARTASTSMSLLKKESLAFALGQRTKVCRARRFLIGPLGQNFKMRDRQRART